jgi:hypothetical protein
VSIVRRLFFKYSIIGKILFISSKLPPNSLFLKRLDSNVLYYSKYASNLSLVSCISYGFVTVPSSIAFIYTSIDLGRIFPVT